MLTNKPITDYLTQYSGITEEMMKDVTVTISEVQTKFMSMIQGFFALLCFALFLFLLCLYVSFFLILLNYLRKYYFGRSFSRKRFKSTQNVPSLCY